MDNLIDVSEWNGLIDWKLAAPAISGAYIKAGGGEPGWACSDTNVIYNGSSAKKASLPFGLYWTWNPDAEQGMQIMRFTQLHKRLGATLRPAVTVEFPLNPDKRTYLAKLISFLAVLEYQMGRRVMINTTPFYWDSFRDGRDWSKEHDLWSASYTARPVVPHGWTHQLLWQYTNEEQVPGIQGYVNMSTCKSIATLSLG